MRAFRRQSVGISEAFDAPASARKPRIVNGERTCVDPEVERQRVDAEPFDISLGQQHVRRFAVIPGVWFFPALSRQTKRGESNSLPQPEFIATQHPSGSGPCLASQALMSSGVTALSGLPSARCAMSMMASGTTRCALSATYRRCGRRPEVQRRVHVRAGMLDDHPAIDVKFISCICPKWFLRKCDRAVERRKSLVEGMRQVHDIAEAA